MVKVQKDEIDRSIDCVANIGRVNDENFDHDMNSGCANQDRVRFKSA